MSGIDIAELRKRMDGAIEVLRKEFAGLQPRAVLAAEACDAFAF